MRQINTPEYNRNTWEIYLSEREAKKTIMKSLRVSEPLLRVINKECKTRNIDFSDYMRRAALAGIKEQSGTGKAEAA